MQAIVMATTLLWIDFTNKLYLEVFDCCSYDLALDVFATHSELDMERNHSSRYSLGSCRHKMDFPMSGMAMEKLHFDPTAMLEVSNCCSYDLALGISATDSELDMEKNH